MPVRHPCNSHEPLERPREGKVVSPSPYQIILRSTIHVRCQQKQLCFRIFHGKQYFQSPYHFHQNSTRRQWCKHEQSEQTHENYSPKTQISTSPDAVQTMNPKTRLQESVTKQRLKWTDSMFRPSKGLRELFWGCTLWSLSLCLCLRTLPHLAVRPLVHSGASIRETRYNDIEGECRVRNTGYHPVFFFTPYCFILNTLLVIFKPMAQKKMKEKHQQPLQVM